MGPTGVSYRAPTPQERCRYRTRTSAGRDETSLMSQNTAPTKGPEIAKRSSFDSSHKVNPPIGMEQTAGSGLKLFAGDGSQLRRTCCAAVCGLKNGTTPWGAIPRIG